MIKGYLLLLAIQILGGSSLDPGFLNQRPDEVDRPYTISEAYTYVHTLARVVPVLEDQEKVQAAFSASGIEPERFQAIARRFDLAWALLHQKEGWEEILTWPADRRPTLMEIAATVMMAEMFNRVEAAINQKVYFPSKNN